MKKSYPLVSTFVFLACFALHGKANGQYTCDLLPGLCNADATCNGDWFQQTGCHIQCFTGPLDNPVPGPSADCTPTP